MSTHLDAEAIALYAERGAVSPRGAEIAAHLRECDACLLEVVQARNAADLAEIAGNSAPIRRAALPPRLARYVREKPKGSAGAGIVAGVAAAIGGAIGAVASPNFSEEMAFGDVRNEGHDASQGAKGHDPSDSHETEAKHMSESPDFMRPDPVIGTPLSDGDYFPGQQSYADTCAIRCQEFIIRQYTGIDAPEKLFVDEARAHGWYQDGHGTNPADVGKLLELHGIPVHRYVEANQWHLAAELMQGHKVIIGVDSDELWRQNPILTDLRHLFGLGAADHAVVVSGIDTTDPDHVKVIVSDPGTGETAARYPLEQFMSAWSDSNFFMVATQEPPPEHLHLPEMSHFDYESGHLDHVGALSWDDVHDACEEPAHHDHDAHADVHTSADEHDAPFDDPHHHAAFDDSDAIDPHGHDGHHHDDSDDGGGHHHG